jgi:hypothetical protein
VSKRDELLARRSSELLRLEAIAGIRLRSAERYLSELADAPDNVLSAPLATAELEAARLEVDGYRRRRELVIFAQMRHAIGCGVRELVIMLDEDAPYVMERSCDKWHELGVCDNPIMSDYYVDNSEHIRLYTADQVDDLLDWAGVDPLNDLGYHRDSKLSAASE